MEAAAKAAVEAVEEAKQKAEKLRVEIDKLQTDYDAELARLVKTSDPVTHHQKSVREAFQALSGSVEAQPLISQLESGFTGLSSMLVAATPTPQATDARDDIDMQLDEDRDFERSLEGLSADDRELKKAKFARYVDEERRV